MAKWWAVRINVLEKFGLADPVIDINSITHLVTKNLYKYYDSSAVNVSEKKIDVNGSLLGWFYNTSKTDVQLMLDIIDGKLIYRAEGDVGLSMKTLAGLFAFSVLFAILKDDNVFGLFVVLLALNFAGFWIFERPRVKECFSDAVRELKFELGNS